MTTDQIRWGWTLVTALGMLFAMWNFREVSIDDRAVRQIRTRSVDLLRMQTRAAVWDMGLILIGLAAHFLAGICAVSGWSLGALVGLIIGEVAFIGVAVNQVRQRRSIFRALRVRGD